MDVLPVLFELEPSISVRIAQIIGIIFNIIPGCPDVRRLTLESPVCRMKPVMFYGKSDDLIIEYGKIPAGHSGDSMD
jgi:hypothetical protein